MGREYNNSHPILAGIPSLNPVLVITKNVRTIQGIVRQKPPFQESPGIKNPKTRPAKNKVSQIVSMLPVLFRPTAL
ncbi:MAG: hypothetical protein OIN90_12175 [Candidatus Methanoperedens sp.]|nr:hypothetical protein [Candidatus Methanoperedens sp.]